MGGQQPAPRSEAQDAGVALVGELVDELLAADVYLLNVPMYNFGVPQQVKHWVDLIIMDECAANTNVQILAGRPALLNLTKGGAYGAGTPREGDDRASPWLRTILADTWGLDLTLVDLELTMAAHVPAMRELLGLAEQIRERCEEEAMDWADSQRDTHAAVHQRNET